MNDPARRVAWRSGWDQQLRYDSLVQAFLPAPDPLSLLDVGCGLGDLLPYLRRRGLEDVDYTGIDVLPSMIAGARERHPADADRFLAVDLLSDDAPPGKFDVVVCSGALNVGVQGAHRSWAKAMIEAMWARTGRTLAFNALGAGLREFAGGATGAGGIRKLDPAWLVAVCRTLTPRISVSEDVLPRELVVHCFRGPAIAVERWAATGLPSGEDVASAYLDHGLSSAAEACLPDAGRSAVADNLRAVAHLQRREAGPARRILARLVEEDPMHAEVRRNLAAALSMDGDELGGIEVLRGVLADDSADDGARAALFWAYVRLDDTASARAQAEQVLDEALRRHLLGKVR